MCSYYSDVLMLMVVWLKAAPDLDTNEHKHVPSQHTASQRV